MLNNEDKQNLIKYRLEQADETIADVKILIDNNRLRSAVNRIYYGMFYALSALSISYSFQTSKHRQLIGWFNKNFIRTGEIEQSYGKSLNKAYNLRSEGDYDVYVNFDKQEVDGLFDNIKSFILRLKIYLGFNETD